MLGEQSSKSHEIVSEKLIIVWMWFSEKCGVACWSLWRYFSYNMSFIVPRKPQGILFSWTSRSLKTSDPVSTKNMLWFLVMKKLARVWIAIMFAYGKKFMIMLKIITSKMKLQIIQRILKISIITLVIFGMLWVIMIILNPDVEFLRNIPFGGISFLLALIIFPIYLRIRRFP